MPEYFEIVKWAVIFVLGYFILPLKKKVEKNGKAIAENDKKVAIMETHYGHIKESLDEIKRELRTLNGKKR